MNVDLSKVEKYWDTRPCNVRHSGSEIGSRIFFEEVTERRFFVEPHIKSFLQPELYRSKKVLELGCGIGTDAALLVEHGANYFGIELSNESLKLARKRFEIFGLAGSFFHSPIENFSMQAQGISDVDLVYSFGVLHHTIDPVSALKNIVSQVKTGTEFKIMLYSRNSWKSALILAGLDQPEAQDNCPIAYTYTKLEALNFLKSCGIKEISITQDHIFMYSVKEYKNYIYKKEPWFESMPESYLNALRNELGWHLLLHGFKE
jgi:SAM-dependent methyltransferase